MNSSFAICIQRIRNGESLRTMARRLNISPTYLSAMEQGKKKVPLDFYYKIINEYHISNDLKNELYYIIVNNNKKVVIDLIDDNKKNGLIIEFSKKIDSINEEQIKRINDILKEE